jgi:hypothetical protein
MILMSCSGYDPSHALKTWHEFDAILKRQAIVTQFHHPIAQEIAQRHEKLQKQGRGDNLQYNNYTVLTSMVKDGLLQLFGNEKTFDSFVYPGFVSSFPLEPSIHPYDGVFTGRVSVTIFLLYIPTDCGCMAPALSLWLTPIAGAGRPRRAMSLHLQRRAQVGFSCCCSET